MFRGRAMWQAGLVCLVMAGCQGSTPTGKQTDAEGNPTGETASGNAKTPGQESVKPLLPVLEGVDSWEGNWVLAPYMGRRFANVWMVRLESGDGGAWKATTLANEPSMGTVTPGDLKVNDSVLQLSATLSNPKAQIKSGKISFEGKLTDGMVRGNLLFEDQGLVLPAQLIPTDADALSDYQESTILGGTGEFDKALQEPDPARSVWRFAQTVPGSPLALDAYGFLFSQIHQWNLKEEEIREVTANFQTAADHWGPRLRGNTEITVASFLARSRKSLDVAEALFDSGETMIQGLAPAEQMLKASRGELRIAKALLAVGGKDEAAAAPAYADLQQLIQEHPYRPDLLAAAADYAEKHQQPDAAIQYYQTIVALPLMQHRVLSARIGLAPGDPTPRSALEKLWQEKHGSLDGLEAALETIYTERIEQLMDDTKEKALPYPAADAGNRVVLLEIFTGAGCEPCVAADLAVELVQRQLPAEEVIVLNYHNHIPAPDPLTNMDCEQRGTFYNVQGTPAVMVNGIPIGNVGGSFFPEAVLESYRRLQLPLEHFLKTSTEIAIDLKAEAADGKLNVHAAVTGVPEADLNNVRLRLAVVEDQIDFHAANGIRHHHQVVRTLLGGARGIAAKQGELKFNLPLPLHELKHRQLAYLMSYEHGKRVTFPEKPAEYKSLRLVAFVQHEQNKEVLQAASTPVTGELVFPEVDLSPLKEKFAPAEAERPAPAKPAGEEQPAEKATEKTEP